ncbi:MAG: L,D-transpeptidase [Polyangiaceae bacterium]|nr:L,D-transpeptidase [Polyangiaceae bacterium]
MIALLLLGACAKNPAEDARTEAPPAIEAGPERAGPPPDDDDNAAPKHEEHDGPRIGSLSFRTWIWPEPNRNKDRLAIGAIRVGTSVRLKSVEPVGGTGCNNKWYAVEPHGFVCADETTTRKFDTPYWRALASLRPGAGAYPYRYAFSMGAPMYSRIPTKGEQKSAEIEMPAVGEFKTLGKWSEGHEELVIRDRKKLPKPDGPIPAFYSGTDSVEGSPWNPTLAKVKTIPAGSGFAYARVFEAEGRVWLLTPDLFLVPADRTFPYERSSFKGVELSGESTLPVAWVRSPEKRVVFLTGKRETEGKLVRWEAKDGSWIVDDDTVTVVERPKKLKHGISEKERWIEASILGGTMTAFEGLEPIYTTLWSPGLGGIPVKGNNAKQFATTEIGVFPIQWKDAVETMSPDPGAPTVFWFADVPWIQYVHAPMAMHVAYWHDKFGHPMSAECLNVSAEDGKWLFDFTLPKLPPGWGSVGAGRLSGPSTKINIIP